MVILGTDTKVLNLTLSLDNRATTCIEKKLI